MMLTADYAAVEPATGKFNILGVFDRIVAKQFPTRHSRMCLVVKIEGEMHDKRKEHRVSVTFTDEDGKELAAVNGTVKMSASSPGIPPDCNVVMEFNEVVFEAPGEYRFYLQVNGGEIDASTVIQVVQEKQPDAV